MMTRPTLADPFTNPVSVPGLRTRPFDGCTRLAGTCSPLGGCENEEVCVW
jgi:hypothetical protein